MFVELYSHYSLVEIDFNVSVMFCFHCLSQTGRARAMWRNSIYIKFESVWFLLFHIPICVFLNDNCTGKIGTLNALAV